MIKPIVVILGLIIGLAVSQLPISVVAYNRVQDRICDMKRDELVADIKKTLVDRAEKPALETEAWVDAGYLSCGLENPRVLIYEVAEQVCAPEHHVHMTCDITRIEERDLPVPGTNTSHPKKAFPIVLRARPVDDQEPCACDAETTTPPPAKVSKKRGQSNK